MKKKKKLTKDQEHRKFIEGKLKSMPKDSNLRKQTEHNLRLIDNGAMIRNEFKCLDKKFDNLKNKDNEPIFKDNFTRDLIVGSFVDLLFSTLSISDKKQNKKN